MKEEFEYNLTDGIKVTRPSSTEIGHPTFESDNFVSLRKFLNEIFDNNSSVSAGGVIQIRGIEQGELTKISEHVALKSWKNTDNISTRLLSVFDQTVLLECLVDLENQLYEEREFSITLFEGYDLTPGNLFYLRFFSRTNEVRMEVHADTKFVNAGDFPKPDFKEIFSNSQLFKS
jgi:hypothetical protein